MISVSIIVPVYNVETYIKECLQSVMAQTYQGPIECILVDDCGTDQSMEIAENLVSSYCGPIAFRILHHEHNRGLSAARNTGMKIAKGDYLFFLDSDDKMFPDCINTLTSIADKYSNVEMVVGGISSEGRASLYDITRIKNRDEFITDVNKLQKIILQGVVFPVMAWNKLIKRSFFIENKLFFKERIIHEDVHWNFYIQRCVHSVAFAQVPTYVYRINPAGIVEKSKKNKKSEESYKIIIDDIYNTIFNSKCITIYEIAYLIRYIFVYMDLAGNGTIDEITHGNQFLKKALLIKNNHKTNLPKPIWKIYQKFFERYLLYRIKLSINS